MFYTMKEYIHKVGDTWMISKETPLEKAALSFFHECWGAGTHHQVFPGPQPISIERRHFRQLAERRYVVCEKTDGVRYAFICFLFEDKKVCALVNRNLEMRYVNLNVASKAKRGTLVDGELVGTKFMIYDAVKVNGRDCSRSNFLERYALIEQFCTGIMKVASDPIELVPKHFETMEGCQHYIENVLPTIPYKTDGLVFTPVDEPIRVGTHETMFKWKPLEKNTIDFQVKWEPRGVWGLYIQDKGLLYFESELPPDMAPHWFAPDVIAECEFITHVYPMYWNPVQPRTDKNYPNNRRTFYRTLVNIRENIQLREFYALCPSRHV